MQGITETAYIHKAIKIGTKGDQLMAQLVKHLP